MYRLCVFTFVLMSFPVTVGAGWTRIYGGDGDDMGQCIRQTRDGGYIVAGTTESFGRRLGSLWFLKINRAGDTLWSHTYGRFEGSMYNSGSSIEEASDGGFIICGTTMTLTLDFALDADLWLVKVDSLGYPEWEKTYGGDGFATGEFVVQTSEGGYLATGCCQSRDDEYPSILMAKTDDRGNTKWWKTYRSTGSGIGYCTREVEDGDYITCGLMNEDLFIIKSDTTGEILWTKTYGGQELDLGSYIEQTQDGGFILVGQTGSYGSGKTDVWLLKTDKYGDTVWTRTYGGRREEVGQEVHQTHDGGYIIAGITKSFGNGRMDVWLLKTNAKGDTIWTRTYGKWKNDGGLSLDLATDGGFIVTGYKTNRDEDLWILKTDAKGDTL